MNTDPITTLRSAITALQSVGEVPNGWVLHPSDAAAIDLSRWGTAGGLLVGGFESGGDPSSANIFGPNARRVVSTSVPAGTAVLGDWSKLRVYVREDTQLAIDASGELFRATSSSPGARAGTGSAFSGPARSRLST